MLIENNQYIETILLVLQNVLFPNYAYQFQSPQLIPSSHKFPIKLSCDRHSQALSRSPFKLGFDVLYLSFQSL